MFRETGARDISDERASQCTPYKAASVNLDSGAAPHHETAGSDRVSARGLLKLAARLSERDWQIVRFLAQHRYATTSHIRRLYFTGHANLGAATRATVRVLDRLLTHRVLDRLERAVGGAERGSAAYTWRLGHIGERLLRADHGEPRKRLFDPSPPFLTHALALTELRATLHEAATRGEFSIMSIEIEREAWRGYAAPSGARAVLQPDLTLTIATDKYEDVWYIEVDLGTESLPVLLRKCRTYETYRATGRAQREHGVFPRVLWLLHTDRRAAQLQAAITADAQLTNDLFLTTTLDQAVTAIRGTTTVPSSEGS